MRRRSTSCGGGCQYSHWMREGGRPHSSESPLGTGHFFVLEKRAFKEPEP